MPGDAVVVGCGVRRRSFNNLVGQPRPTLDRGSRRLKSRVGRSAIGCKPRVFFCPNGMKPSRTSFDITQSRFRRQLTQYTLDVLGILFHRNNTMKGTIRPFNHIG
jgi:hypothetical protein